MSYVMKQTYNKYFQKSKSFLFPILGYRKDANFLPIQVYMSWEGLFTIEDRKIIVVYENLKTREWNKFLMNLMNNQMFNDYHDIGNDKIIVLSFDLNCIEEDYRNVLEGKYSKLSKLLKKKISDFYSYNSPEWVYMESFLFPDKYVTTYSEILDVEEEHIRFTGELCDLPNLEKETFKTEIYDEFNDVDQINMEPSKNIQTDSDKSGLPLQ